MILFSLRFLLFLRDQQFSESDQAQHVRDPEGKRDHEERKLREHRRVVAAPELRYGNEKKDCGNVTKIDTQPFTLRQRAGVSVGPQVKVDVQQEGIRESNTDDRDGVGDSEKGGPGIKSEIEKPVESDNQITCMPTAHGQGEGGEEALDDGQFVAMGDELHHHPKWQQRTNAITYDLKYFERIEWGHRLRLALSHIPYATPRI